MSKNKKYRNYATDGRDIVSASDIVRGEVDSDRLFPEGVQVRQSVCGLGLYAVRAFKKGARIGQVHGLVITDPGYESRYCIDGGDNLSLEPFSPYCYLNHCCEPNAQFFNYTAGRKDAGLNEGESLQPEVLPCKAKRKGDRQKSDQPELEIWVEAIRPIRKGDEIRIDYCWPASEAIRCHCGSPKCRGWVVDPAELDQVAVKQQKTE